MLDLVLQLTKGILRDPKTRRSVIFYIMLVAIFMVFFGWFFLSVQWARQNKLLYLGYWAVCAWLTLASTFLAVFDALLIRAASRAKRRLMEAELLRETEKPPEKP